MSEEERLQCVKDTLDAVNEHLIEGGTYRYLIYHRLGFDVESGAYCELMSGLNISNAFCELEELKEKNIFLNKMNVENYEKYCEALKENKELKIQLHNRTMQYDKAWDKGCLVDVIKNWLEKMLDDTTNFTELIIYEKVLSKIEELEKEEKINE